MMFKKLILAGLLSLLSVGSALAACTNPLAIKDATLATISMSTSSGADGFCQYNFNLNQIGATAIATGSGVMTAGTQRTALATDSPGIVALGQTTKSASVPMAIASDQVGSAGTANATVITVQGIASMTKLLVTPDSVALPANQSVNVAQVNGVTTLTGTGAVGTGTQRVAVGTDTATIAGSAPTTALIANPTNGYPVAAIPETNSATGTTAATTATLATAVGKTTYICGFSIRANATAAATANSTITGTITGTLNFTQWTAPLASGIGLTEQRFTPCIPASATNTTIAVVSAAPGSGGVVSVSAWGFQL